jgi:16S rRNA (guanine966-N2)-methyltransferase
MKDRVREAVFNLLTNSVRGTHAIDLFAGTGALGLEALSRGATSATLVERHIPTAKVIRENAQMLGAERRANVVGGDAFYWAGRLPSPTNIPWIVFVSPPFELYVTACSEMLELIGKMLDSAPPGSTLVVESDDRFDHQGLPQPEAWDVRSYPPAVVAIYRK